MDGKTISHYKILSKLGGGGMGEVYLAQDEKLDRTVALKILPAEFASNPTRMRRFVQEAKAASALDHSNVAHIYEIGEADGTSFIAMQYIEGETLDKKLKEGPLQSREIVDIAIQIADALDAAAAKGIVHRDIKALNIMSTPRGQIKVLDFGLAKIEQLASLQPETSKMETAAGTSPGMIVGTAQYMSPEQALGKSIDHRSDIYSLGVVLYQLATARLPFSGNTASEILNRILNSQPDAIARLNYNIEPELERIIRKCMEKDPERRYQTAHELFIDLKNLKRDSESGQQISTIQKRTTGKTNKIAIALGLLILAAFITGYFLFIYKSKGEIRSLAVLPFTNSDTENEWLTDGITETTINSLSQIPDLKVMARSTVNRFKSSDPLETGKKLKVDAVLTGSVDRQNDDLVIAAELVNVSDGSLIWGKNYRNNFSNLTIVQRDISENISDELRKKLTGNQKHEIAKEFNVNPEAYELYLKGRFHWNLRTHDGIRKSIDYFNQAIGKDGSFARAYAGLALAYVVRVSPFSKAVRLKEGMAAANKAVELDPLSAEAYAALGGVEELRTNWDGAAKDYRKAIELEPNYPTAHQWLGETLAAASGRIDEGISELKKALEYDPLSPIINTSLATVLYYARRYDEAITQYRKAIELDRKLPHPREGLVKLLVVNQEYLEAIREYEQFAKEDGRFESEESGINEIRNAFLSNGEKGFWQKKLELNLQEGDHLAYEIMWDYANLGEIDKAFEWMDKIIQLDDQSLNEMKVDPIMDPLRNDSRFKKYLHLLNLE